MKEQVATLDASSVAVHRMLPPELKATESPGCPAPVTVAVSTVGLPCMAGVGFAESNTVTAAGWMVNVPSTNRRL